MHKYFPKWKYLNASSNSDMIISWHEKCFASYIEKLFIPINDAKSSLRLISDGLTTPQRTEKQKERIKPDFFLYEGDDSHMLDPVLAKDISVLVWGLKAPAPCQARKNRFFSPARPSALTRCSSCKSQRLPPRFYPRRCGSNQTNPCNRRLIAYYFE